MEVSLHALERLVLMRVILPQKDNLITMRLVREIIQKIGLTDEEIKYYGLIEQADGRLVWNEKTIREEKKFDFGDSSTDIIKRSLKKFGETPDVEGWMLDLFDKFGVEISADSGDKK